MKMDREELDRRMEEAGMIPLTQLLEDDQPLDHYTAHAAVVDMDSFEWYLKTRYEKFLLPQIIEDLEKHERNEMSEWYLGHSAAYKDILVNYRKAKRSMAMQGLADVDQELI